MSRDVLRGLTLCCLLLEYMLRTCTCKYNCDYRNKQKLKVNGLLDLVVLQSSKLGGILIEYLRCLVCLFVVFVCCVCLVCLFGVFVRCVYLVCLFGEFVWCVCLVCLFGVFVWCVCLVCLIGVFVWCVCLVGLFGVFVSLLLCHFLRHYYFRLGFLVGR